MKKMLPFLLASLVAFFTLSVAHALPPEIVEARETLVRGVKAVDSEGAPGAVFAVGKRSFPVINTEKDRNVVAACFYEKGRVVAFGHPSFVSSVSLQKADTRTFVKNALAWLAGDGATTVAVYRYQDAEKGLSSLEGVKVEPIPHLGLLGKYKVLACYPDGLRPEDVERVRGFVMQGGGLLCAGIGWGWAQVTKKNSFVKDSLFNRLLGPAGLYVTDAFADRNDKLGYVVRKEIKDSMLADEKTFLLRMEKREEVDVWNKNPVALYKADGQASIYPGLPAQGTPRISRRLIVDLAVPRWHSTGLFAVAGEPLTVSLPENAEKLGLKVRIGTTTCNLLGKPEWKRAPKVDIEAPLTNRVTTLSSPFGGMVYIVVPQDAKIAAKCKVDIGKACPAPWFKMGRDREAAWRTIIRNYPAPWAELESDKIILSVPAEEARKLDNPAELLVFWGKILDLDAKLTGIPEERKSAERICWDVQLCAGWLHAGYPVMYPKVITGDLLNVKKLRKEGDWGFFHELGHNHQNGDWTFDGTGEVTVNIFTLYDLDKFCGIPPGKTRMAEPGQAKQVREWVARGKPFDEWKREPFLALEVFKRLQEAYGWETYEKLFAEYRTLRPDERPKNDDEKRNQFVTRLSQLTRENAAAVFRAWSIPVGDAAYQFCSKYPLPRDTRLLNP